MSNYVYEQGLLPNQLKITIYLDYAGDGADDQSGGYREGSTGSLEQNKHFETDIYTVTLSNGTSLSFSIKAICTGDEDTAMNYGMVMLKNVSPSDIYISKIKAENLTYNTSLVLPLWGNYDSNKTYRIEWRIGDVKPEPEKLIPYQGRDIYNNPALLGTPMDILLTF